MFDVFYIDQINSIKDACNSCRTRYLWILDRHNNYLDFDFAWEPPPWESNQIHVWPSQHQQHGGTMLVPKSAVEEKNYNHNVVQRTQSVPRLHIKHNPNNPDSGNVNTRYISDYLGTMRRALSKTDWEYCWVTADVCDYKDFDFTWHPSEWQQDMLHVFPSNEQKFGDTFYVHVPSFLAKTETLEILEWFETLNFLDTSVPRLDLPLVRYDGDDLYQEVLDYTFTDPIAVFYRDVFPGNIPAVSLWQQKLKTVVPLSKDSSTVVVPRECKNHISTQIYDYPYVDKTQKTLEATPQDIIFISYDETNADENYEILKQRFPRAKRLHGVDGMVTALKRAAEMSSTPYYYAVFAKTQIYEGFQFNFDPDYLQRPCNYLFHGRNMSNGLEYGTLGVTMYNCKMIIEAETWDVDFTTSFPVTVVPKLSALGYFATDPYRAWRTAFRECTKLESKCIRGQVTIETNHRLHTWTTHAEGPYAEWVLRGANDGVEYAKTIANEDDLMIINDWNWLKDYFDSKYSAMLEQM